MSQQSVTKTKRPYVATQHLCRDRVRQGLDFSCRDRVFLCHDKVFPRVGFSVATEVFQSRQSWPGREVFLSRHKTLPHTIRLGVCRPCARDRLSQARTTGAQRA